MQEHEATKDEKTLTNIYWLMRAIALSLYFWSIQESVFGKYTIFRFLITSISIVPLYVLIKNKKRYGALLIGLTIFLFSPLLPYYLVGEIRRILPIIIGSFIIIYTLSEKEPPRSNDNYMMGIYLSAGFLYSFLFALIYSRFLGELGFDEFDILESGIKEWLWILPAALIYYLPKQIEWGHFEWLKNSISGWGLIAMLVFFMIIFRNLYGFHIHYE